MERRIEEEESRRREIDAGPTIEKQGTYGHCGMEKNECR